MRVRCKKFIAIAMLLAAGCKTAAAGLPIRLMMNWQAQAEQCGFYEAKAKGYYRAAGVDATLVTGGPDINDGILLAAGNVDFMVADSIEVLLLRSRGVPIVAVAAFFQRDPQTIAAHPDPLLRKPEDLRGHPMLIANGSRNRFWLWAKARFGFTDQQLRPYAFSGVPFLADPRSAQQGYITNDGYVIGKALGKPPTSFLLADYGYENYGDVLATTQQMIRLHPDAVQAVVSASQRGWEDCAHGDAAAARQAILQANPTSDPSLYDYSFALMRKDAIITGIPAVKIGSMTDTRWSAFLASMKQLGVVPTNADYDGAYTQHFSNGAP